MVGAAEELGVRMIVPDRPGMGRSQFQARRRIEEWPADVLELADALGIDRFDEGHLSLFANRQREILRGITLAAAAAPRTAQSDE